MNNLNVGVSLEPRRYDSLTTSVQIAEVAGIDTIAFGDSQSMYREVFVSLAVAAMKTNLPRLQVVTTNPVTRHPSVVASAIATINELSQGRAALTYATGDSAVRNIGKRPARIREVQSAITTVRDLIENGCSTWEGDNVQFNWDADPVPIFMVAEGPKTLETAGRIADGVFIGGGVRPEVIADGVERVREAAIGAGRDPDDIEYWAPARFNVRETSTEAIDELKTNLAAAAHHVFQHSIEEKHVPEKHREAIKTLHQKYDPGEHMQYNQSHNRELVERLGLTEYLADRFTVAGSPARCTEKLAELADTELDGVLLLVRVPDHQRALRQLGRDIL